MKKKVLLVVGLILSMALVLAACGSSSSSSSSSSGSSDAKSIADQGDITWTYAHTGRNGDAIDQYAKLLKKNMEAEFPNVTLKLSGNAKLGNESQRMELVHDDGVEFAQFLFLELGSSVPAAEGLGINYILPQDSDKLTYVVQDGKAIKYLNGLLADKGYQALAWYPESYSCITSNKKLTTDMSSLKGQKIRAMNSSIDVANAEGFGASAQTLDYSEIYSGLQLGTVDGQMNPPSIIAANKYYEVQKYMLLTHHECVLDVSCVSPSLWKSLSDSDKEKIQEVFNKTNAEAIKDRDKTDKEALETIKKAKPDMKIIEMSDDQINTWAKTAGEKAKKVYLKDAGEDGQKFLDLLQEDIDHENK